MATLMTVGIALLLVGYLVIARKQDRGKSAVVASAAACAGMALAGFSAVRSFANVLEEVSRSGGGIREVSRGIWQAALLPTGAAIAAVVVAGVAMLLLLVKRDAANAPGSFRGLSMPAVALVCGAVALLLFRDSIVFVLDVITPGSARGLAVSSIPGAIATRLLVASIGGALCFVVALVLTVRMMRTPASATFGSAMAVLVLTLIMAAVFASSFHRYADHYRTIHLHGSSAVAGR